MKIPFERNHYFWGKLLSAEDFTAEQRYHNEKRWFLNCLLYGAGVLCGLDVIKLDEKKILVQTGAALDSAGRELVLSAPKTENISLIEGFSFDNQEGFSYLCLCFGEKFQQEAVALEPGGAKQYNRILEDVRLCFTQTPPLVKPPPQSLDEALEDSGLVYLAKVYFVTGRDTFVIEAAEDMRHMLLERSPHAPENKKETLPADNTDSKIETFLRRYAQLVQRQAPAVSGVTLIEFGLRGKRDRVFFSDPVTHGLGGGAVCLTLGVVTESADSQTLGERSVCYGEADLFDTDFAVAAKCNMAAGTFVIAVRILRDTPLTQACIHWTAVRGKGEGLPVRDDVLSIEPDVAVLRCRESVRFSLKGAGIVLGSVTWRIVESDGGSIDAEGLYRAPNKPGIFEVLAETEGREASAFVRVKG